MMWRRIALSGLLILVPAVVAAQSGRVRQPADGLGSAALPVSESLRPQIDFWKKVFATYGDNQVVIHDSQNLARIYRVLDFSDLAASGFSAGEIQRVREEGVAAEKEYFRGALIRVSEANGDPSSLSEDERKLLKLFRGESPGAIREAAQPDRIRAQRGIRERFARGVAVSRRYLPDLERIFREEGVPELVTRLALVESCFNVEAYSKVGAAGVWQFMPGTGRLFMQVDDHIDERRDPLIAGRGAARFLRRNYDRLGTWPLAITAYNHGPNGIAKAIDITGTVDIATIIRTYRGPLFGFASRNFYPEFVAAVEIDARHEQHFPGLDVHRPIPTEPLRFPDAVTLRTALEVTDVERDTFLELNPSLGDAIRANRVAIPRGYQLSVPMGKADDARLRYASLPAGQRAVASTKRVAGAKNASGSKASSAKKSGGGSYVVHKVRKGQTLLQIAKQYGTTVDQLKSANGLNRSGSIRVGQAIKVPKG